MDDNWEHDPLLQGFGLFRPLPQLFHSLELGGPFRRCLNCNLPLRLDTIEGADNLPHPYMIERVFRGSEPILEYAMCFGCRSQLGGGISALSMQRITAYFEERVDLEARLQRLFANHEQPLSVDAWIDHCAVTGRPRAECDSFQVLALCQDDALLLGPLPLLISDEAAEEMQRLLSPETKGWMDDFIADNFGMPPEFCEPPVPLLI